MRGCASFYEWPDCKPGSNPVKDPGFKLGVCQSVKQAKGSSVAFSLSNRCRELPFQNPPPPGFLCAPWAIWTADCRAMEEQAWADLPPVLALDSPLLQSKWPLKKVDNSNSIKREGGARLSPAQPCWPSLREGREHCALQGWG